MSSIHEFPGADKVLEDERCKARESTTNRKPKRKPNPKPLDPAAIPDHGPVVYALRNTENGRVYIGSTRQFRARSQVHLSDLRAGTHQNVALQVDWTSYGEAAFRWEFVGRGYHREEQEAILAAWRENPDQLYNDLPTNHRQSVSSDNTMDGQNESDIFIENPAIRRGFTQIPNHILSMRELSANAKLVYMMLLSYAWKDGSCFPGQERMAYDLGVHLNTIGRALQELQSHGLIEIQRRGLQKTNRYIIRDLDTD